MLKRIGNGLLIVVDVVVGAVIALLVIKPWAPRYVVDEPGPTGVRLTDDGLIANFYATPRGHDGNRGSSGGCSGYPSLASGDAASSIECVWRSICLRGRGPRACLPKIWVDGRDC